MKRILFFFAIIAILVSCGTAKSVSYTHKPIAAEGLQIIVTVKSDRLVFGDSPIMMLKNFKGEVLKLDGINLQSRSESSGVLINNIVVPITELSALAQFPVNKEDIPFFESGISKVRLSTVPIVHEKEFSTDVIGAYLLSALKKASSAEDDF